ncbi:MAG TPA: endonuclease V, partial [Chloroflexi bacterium]|nr:endonuclease V [Chloroflexota bacterium]
IATHMGLLLDLPAIGCAKSRLCGYYEEPGPERGDRSPLLEGEEVIGMVVRSRTGVSPIFVSIGHRVSLESAVEIVLRCCTKYRLPEPTRLAHQAAAGVQVVPSAHQPGLF